ncbi:hypothetical protein ACFWNL_31205 [Kitasatospora sp. NPDC058397]|uniref:hypothetical protein n=1 Tax=Kitasatospora sp. NPDC058397 TaxID=3346478 RepID=UPI003653EEE3
MEAALASNAEIIAVATGVDSQADLVAAGASTVLPDLSDTSGLLGLLRSFASH